ncbi:hypothetical protein GC177_05380 [bacterium]|nr:hypothetical protein [bacterium]
MIITLFASLLGFIGSVVPECFKMFQDKRDRAHELEILRLQFEQQKLGLSQRMEEVRLQLDSEATKAIYGTYTIGVKWVDALNGTVRPILAYAFFALYAAVKLLQWVQFQIIVASAFEMAGLLWSAEDQAIFAAIISFYFGHRAMQQRAKA